MSILALTSDTLVGTAGAGQIEYNGQFFGTDSNSSRAQLQRIVQGTAVASTSGTSIDYTGLPSWIKKITVMFSGVSSNGTSLFLIQIGSGSVTTSGYSSASIFVGTMVASTAGFLVDPSKVAASVISGNVVITLLGSNTYTSTGAIYLPGSYVATNAGVSPALSGALDRVRITTVNGTDTFDAGSVNIIYEG